MNFALTQMDWIALEFFLFAWLFFELISNHSAFKYKSLAALMAHRRREWMLEMSERDLRMIDTSILQGLQNGAAFFASTTIFAIGGSFALLGATDMVMKIYSDLPVEAQVSRELHELRVFGLTAIFIYAFFKFGWSYRLFNYCSILMGAVPMVHRGLPQEARKTAIMAAEMNIIAGRHFTAGMRGMFFALAYLGWFISPEALFVSTIFVLVVLTRRNYFSQARRVLAEGSK